MTQETPSGDKPTCILALQGGGAMGAYHIGALQALCEHRFDPDWISGISIGAINGAIMAGNPPETRLAKLEAFWETISRVALIPSFGDTATRTLRHILSFAQTLEFGQPGFFTPRLVNPWLAAPGVAATSYYDTAPLYATLDEVVDFARLNDQKTRLSVGATHVETGRLVFFDTAKMAGRFGPQHVVASCSLPPGFPATAIDGGNYWDGGCVSNSPLQAVIDDMPSGHVVVFIIDLWSASGAAPDTMAGVAWRAKQIRYASEVTGHLDWVATKLKLLRIMRRLGQPTTKPLPERVDLVHIIYHPGEDQIPSSDAEFSRGSLAMRRDAGLADMRVALAERPWLRPESADHLGCLVHRVTPAGVATLPAG
jgi:NTE family protein